MKLQLISVFCFFSFGVFGQVPDNKNQRTMPYPDSLFKKFKGSDNNEFLQQQLQNYLQRKKQENQLLANKNGNVDLLPQDHMPA